MAGAKRGESVISEPLADLVYPSFLAALDAQNVALKRFVYALCDPREVEVTRYVGCSFRVGTRYRETSWTLEGRPGIRTGGKCSSSNSSSAMVCSRRCSCLRRSPRTKVGPCARNSGFALGDPRCSQTLNVRQFPRVRRRTCHAPAAGGGEKGKHGPLKRTRKTGSSGREKVLPSADAHRADHEGAGRRDGAAGTQPLQSLERHSHRDGRVRRDRTVHGVRWPLKRDAPVGCEQGNCSFLLKLTSRSTRAGGCGPRSSRSRAFSFPAVQGRRRRMPAKSIARQRGISESSHPLAAVGLARGAR